MGLGATQESHCSAWIKKFLVGGRLVRDFPVKFGNSQDNLGYFSGLSEKCVIEMENMKHFPPDVDVTKKGFVCPGCFLFDRQCSQLKGKIF